jgi:2-hydroxy-6-oxonona-2,4-dienedioate hydrolase
MLSKSEVVMLQRFLLLGAVALFLAFLTLGLSCRHDLHAARERIAGRGQVVGSPFGDIEFLDHGGAGPVVLVVHGSGGGFDQGELVARTVLDENVRWIAPSRFGYLRSTFQPGATFDDQAHAYVYLLDQLGIERVAVVALSHGGPSALLLAALHPERVSSLTLLSCGVASAVDLAQSQANRQGDALTWIFGADWRYWALTRFQRGRLLELMGASPTVVAGLDAEAQQRIDQIVDFMHPVSQRSAGAAFDNRAAMPNERIAGIRAPTLVVHAKDDTLQLFRNAEYAAAAIPGARLLAFEQGGHLLLAIEHETIRAEIRRHLEGSF